MMSKKNLGPFIGALHTKRLAITVMCSLWIMVSHRPWVYSTKQTVGFAVLRTRQELRILHASKRNEADPSRLSVQLIDSLDLRPLVRALADHTGTRRGREAILGLIGEENAGARLRMPSESEQLASAKRRRAAGGYSRINGHKHGGILQSRQSLAPIAASANDARREYELVEQGSLALGGTNGLQYPPLYGASSSPFDTDNVADTDHDEWLELSSEEWTLEHILHADQVVQTLLRVHEWGCLTQTKTWVPGLSEIAQTISKEELQRVQDEIAGSVEIVRIRTIADSRGRSSFTFCLSHERFPELKSLREKEQELRATVEKELGMVCRKLKGSPEVLEYQGRMLLCVPKNQATSELGVVRGKSGGRCYVEPRQLVSTGDELARTTNVHQTLEEEIVSKLTQTVLSASSVIDRGIHVMARLDVLFSKAALGTKLNAAIPKIRQDGQIDVKGFVHPVLAIRDGISAASTETLSSDAVVPVDLLLSNDASSSRALIISGPNGGGKTIAMKSFGLVCLLTKLGLGIPRSSNDRSDAVPRVDFFNDVMIEVGDHQNVLEGESTLMARLNSFSFVIQTVSKEQDSSSPSDSRFFLVLMDELGAGTDPSAGGALAQALVEKLLECDRCRVVATTHSPRLKALSFTNDLLDCASVLLKNDGANDFKLPSYRLQYGTIGDSYALGAASRATPPLPQDVLSRAASLMASESNSSQGADDADYLWALTASLEQELDATFATSETLERSLNEIQSCRNAMITLTETYGRHLGRVEERLQTLYRNVRDDDAKDAIDVVGETLETVKLVRRKLKTDEEALTERGLKKLPIGYQLRQGETVVVVADNEWEGTTATIVRPQLSVNGKLDQNSVVVSPTVSTWDKPFLPATNGETNSQTLLPCTLVMKRSDLAIWAWDALDESDKTPVTSVRESREKLTNLITTLRTSRSKTDNTVKPRSRGSAFKSARERKAAKPKRKRK